MDNKSSLTRRNFLKAMGYSAVFVGLGGSLHILEHDKTFLRPPGAVAEKDFLARCMKCQKCVEVCPLGVVLPITLTDGVMAVSTPTMDFSQGYCNLCMECTLVCPTGALQPISEAEVKVGVAKIVENMCIAWDWAGCTECFTKCPYDAIKLDELARPVVIAEKCNGCGVCEYVCPTASLRAYNSEGSGKGIVVVPL